MTDKRTARERISGVDNGTAPVTAPIERFATWERTRISILEQQLETMAAIMLGTTTSAPVVCLAESFVGKRQEPSTPELVASVRCLLKWVPSFKDADWIQGEGPKSPQQYAEDVSHAYELLEDYDKAHQPNED